MKLPAGGTTVVEMNKTDTLLALRETVAQVRCRAEPIVPKNYSIPDFYIIFPIIPAYLTCYSLIISVNFFHSL